MSKRCGDCVYWLPNEDVNYTRGCCVIARDNIALNFPKYDLVFSNGAVFGKDFCCKYYNKYNVNKRIKTKIKLLRKEIKASLNEIRNEELSKENIHDSLSSAMRHIKHCRETIDEDLERQERIEKDEKTRSRTQELFL